MSATTSNGNGTDANTNPATPAAKQPSKSKLKSLFAEYAKLDDKADAIRASLEAVNTERITLVKAIHDEGGKGPYVYKGAKYKVVVRGDSFFFRGEGKVDAIEVG